MVMDNTAHVAYLSTDPHRGPRKLSLMLARTPSCDMLLRQPDAWGDSRPQISPQTVLHSGVNLRRIGYRWIHTAMTVEDGKEGIFLGRSFIEVQSHRIWILECWNRRIKSTQEISKSRETHRSSTLASLFQHIQTDHWRQTLRTFPLLRDLVSTP